MSVGGKVTEVMDCGEVLWIDTFDGHSPCAIYVEPTPAARCVECGDSVWWQGAHAFWTPKSGGKEDVRLRRVGFSGVKRGTALLRAASFDPARPDAEAGAP